MKESFQRPFSWFAQISMTLVAVVLMLGTLNLVLHFYFQKKGVMTAPEQEVMLIEQKYPEIYEKHKKLGVAEPEKLLNESYAAGMIYEPFTGFRETPREGKWVNVDMAGFRHGEDPQPWPMDSAYENIFFFGGSTTFGYGVMDSQTIPSFLEKLLSQKKKVRVYNFGRSHYYSVQERILFEQLLMKGHVPKVAIFLDGLNDFAHTEEELFQESSMADYWGRNLSKTCNPYLGAQVASIPLVRFSLSLQKRLGLKGEDAPRHILYEQESENDSKAIEAVISRYLWNKKTIESVAKTHGVKPVFVWQPVPKYSYNLEYHEFKRHGFGKAALSGYGYPRMLDIWKSGKVGEHFVWLADLAKDWKETVYIDAVHYSAPFNHALAENIAKNLK